MKPKGDMKPSDLARRLYATVLVMVVGTAFTLWAGTWPEIYTFATDEQGTLIQRLLSAPVHLSDDVMLTMRSGQMILETGAPSFNVTDSAQASTSYVMPYLSALLIAVFPENIALAAYALLGLLSAMLSVGAVVFFARSTLNGVVLGIALLLTQTHLLYALNGWDHLFQGLVFVLAIVLARNATSTRRLITIALLLAVASLVRPDGLLIALALLWVTAQRVDSYKRRKALVTLLTTYVLVAASVLLLNLLQFGFLTPTTARLKFGASPDFNYITDYALSTAFGSFSALTLYIVLFLFALFFYRLFPPKIVAPVLVTTFMTVAVATYNSDVFEGGRMYWVPTLVLALVVAMESPPIGSISSSVRSEVHLKNSSGRVSRRSIVGLVSVTVVVLAGVLVAPFIGLHYAVVAQDEVDRSATAQQYVLTQWVNENLNPGDGSVGLFFGGVAYHLPRFEIADFLGKADESIAQLETHPAGLPGHNKWDIDLTRNKWNPQVILPTTTVDVFSEAGRQDAQRWLDEQWNHAYLPDLFFNEGIRASYVYCYLPSVDPQSGMTYGMLIRRDVVEEVDRGIQCKPWT